MMHPPLARPCAGPSRAVLVVLLLALSLGACADPPVSPRAATPTLARADDAPGGRTGSPFIYRTGFEPSDYHPGSLSGQDGWYGLVAGVDYSGIAVVSDEKPRRGQQAVHISGARLVTNPIPVPAPGTSVVSSLNARDVLYDALAAGTPVVEVEADVRLDGPQTAVLASAPCGGPVVASLTAIGRDPSGRRLRIGFAEILSSGIFCGTDVVGGTAVLGRFHRVGMRIDFEHQTVDYLLDGELRVTRAFLDATATSGVFANPRLDMRAVVGVGADPALYQASFDNLSVRVVRSASAAGQGDGGP